MLVAHEANLADLYCRAFLDIEVDLHRSRRNGLDVGLDGGELVTVFGQDVFEDGLGALYLGCVVLALDGQANLFLLEPVENIGGGDGAVALVIDLADRGSFTDEDVKDDALLRVFAFDAQIFEVTRVPEGVEVSLNRQRIIGVAGMGEEAGENGFLWNAAVADDPNLIYGLRLLGQG